MKTNKILIIAVLILVLFFIIKKLKVEITPTATTTAVVYRRNATHVVRPNPHYNAYKAQYYN